jgi:ribonuclease Z
MTGHSTTLDAARTAIDANAGSLIIGHFSARYKDIVPLVEEARTLFPETYPAIDGKSYEIGNITDP